MFYKVCPTRAYALSVCFMVFTYVPALYFLRVGSSFFYAKFYSPAFTSAMKGQACG